MSMDGFTRLGTYTLPSIAGTHTNLPVVLKYADFHADVLNSLNDNGGDLRITTDEVGLNRLPIEIVSFDKVGQVIIVWTLVPSASTGTVLHVWGDNATATQPAAGEPFGRNAVWVDFQLVTHNCRTDSTGRHSLTNSGSTLSTGVFGNTNGSSYFDGSSDSITASIANQAHNAAQSFRGWFKPTSSQTSIQSALVGLFHPDTTADMTYVAFGSDFNNKVAMWHRSNNLGADSHRLIAYSSRNTTANVWQRFAAYTSRELREATINDDPLSTDSEVYGDSHTFNRFAIGRAMDKTPNGDMKGHIGSVFWQSAHPSESFLLTEYQNQSAVGSWGVMTSTGPVEPPVEHQSVISSISSILSSQIKRALESIGIASIGSTDTLVAKIGGTTSTISNGSTTSTSNRKIGHNFSTIEAATATDASTVKFTGISSTVSNLDDADTLVSKEATTNSSISGVLSVITETAAGVPGVRSVITAAISILTKVSKKVQTAASPDPSVTSVDTIVSKFSTFDSIVDAVGGTDTVTLKLQETESVNNSTSSIVSSLFKRTTAIQNVPASTTISSDVIKTSVTETTLSLNSDVYSFQLKGYNFNSEVEGTTSVTGIIRNPDTSLPTDNLVSYVDLTGSFNTEIGINATFSITKEV